MIVCIDSLKLFQTICDKNKTCNGPGSQSESENRTWHRALTSRKKNVFYILFERIISTILSTFLISWYITVSVHIMKHTSFTTTLDVFSLCWLSKRSHPQMWFKWDKAFWRSSEIRDSVIIGNFGCGNEEDNLWSDSALCDGHVTFCLI